MAFPSPFAAKCDERLTLLANFHTHTFLCKHASGRVEDYVAVAAQGGCEALGFSDHNPYPDGIWSESRMDAADLQGYADSVRRAAKTAPFPVYLGFECEFAPKYEDWLRFDIAERLGTDYLAFGPHWVWDDDVFVYAPHIEGKRLLRDYVNQTVAGIKSGLFKFVAHPDLVMAALDYWDSEAKACCRAILDAACDCNLPLEINGLGLSRKKVLPDGTIRAPYPVREFWEEAVERGAKIICGSDAHRPDEVVAGHIRAREFARSIGAPKIITNIFDQKEERP